MRFYDSAGSATKQNKHMEDSQTSEQKKSTNKTIQPNMHVTVAQYQLKMGPVVAAIPL